LKQKNRSAVLDIFIMHLGSILVKFSYYPDAFAISSLHSGHLQLHLARTV